MDETLLLGVVGTDDQGQQRSKVINKENKVVRHQNYIHDQGVLTSTAYLKLPRGNRQTAGFASGTDEGQIQVLLHPYSEGGISRLLTHKGAVTRVMTTLDSKVLFSAGEDGTLFIYHVSEEKVLTPAEMNAQENLRTLANQTFRATVVEPEAGELSKQIMDPELANIVLVKQDEMEEWLVKQSLLKSELESTKRKVDAKLAEYQQGYQMQEEEIRQQKEMDIQDLNRRYEDLSWQKRLQETQNQEAMRKIEKYHYEEVQEIEQLFEKKLRQEGDGYLQLEQEGLEMKQRYEKQIRQIKVENEKAINKLVEEFANNLNKVQEEYEESKDVSEGLKSYYDAKLRKQEDDHEGDIVQRNEEHQAAKDARLEAVNDLAALQKAAEAEKEGDIEAQKIQKQAY